MHGMFGVFLGMRVRSTKKILGPELVQEATGEVVGIAFHPEERFRHPASSNVRPASSHECWECGWVLCDRLPLHVEVRFDDSAEDYTGLGKPCVWHVAPRKDTWKLPVDAATVTINHPGAARPKVIRGTSRQHRTIEVLRCQLPLTNEGEMTFQNAQGKTIRGPNKEPKGFVIDLHKPWNMKKEEYYQHLQMILGRGQKLEWTMLRNFPMTDEGDHDWSVFERGPPLYICEFGCPREACEVNASSNVASAAKSSHASLEGREALPAGSSK